MKINDDNRAAQLSNVLLELITASETFTEQGSPFLTLTSPSEGHPLGSMRIFSASGVIEKLVLISLRHDESQLNAYMIAAFTHSDSLYPHLVFDAEVSPTDAAFHIDLLHKTDLSINGPYIEEVLQPLSSAFEEANANPNFTPSDATAHMKTLLTPWMASYHSQPKHLLEATNVVKRYTEYWQSLKRLQNTLLASDDKATLAQYDVARRSTLFDPAVDVLWDFLVNIIGLESRDIILSQLRGGHRAVN